MSPNLIQPCRHEWVETTPAEDACRRCGEHRDIRMALLEATDLASTMRMAADEAYDKRNQAILDRDEYRQELESARERSAASDHIIRAQNERVAQLLAQVTSAREVMGAVVKVTSSWLRAPMVPTHSVTMETIVHIEKGVLAVLKSMASDDA
jgi:hypothetical protein